jgi:hypothetical protein
MDTGEHPFGNEPGNGSGLGARSTLPALADRWNWGAFFLGWIWGLGNRSYLAFLVWVPPLSFFMPFVLGAKGNEWAWRNKRWDSLEHFRRVQRKWSVAGLLAAALLLGLGYFGFPTLRPLLGQWFDVQMFESDVESSPNGEVSDPSGVCHSPDAPSTQVRT